jgi:hypothetical protein
MNEAASHRHLLPHPGRRPRCPRPRDFYDGGHACTVHRSCRRIHPRRLLECERLSHASTPVANGPKDLEFTANYGGLCRAARVGFWHAHPCSDAGQTSCVRVNVAHMSCNAVRRATHRDEPASRLSRSAAAPAELLACLRDRDHSRAFRRARLAVRAGMSSMKHEELEEHSLHEAVRAHPGQVGSSAAAHA